MRVLGIDTSLTSTGLAVVGDQLCTTTRIESQPPKRARGDKTPVAIEQRHQRIWDIAARIHSWMTLVDLAVLEAPSYGSQGASTWDRAWLWGAVVDRLIGDDIPVAIVAPRCRALWASGSGASGKSPIAVHLSRMWPDVDPDGVSDDEWDALSLASIGAQYVGLIPCTLQRHREQLAKIQWPATVKSRWLA